MDYREKAQELLKEFKQGRYRYGAGVLEAAGEVAAADGRRAVFVRDTFPGSGRFAERIQASLKTAGVTVAATIDGARPNAPREDLARITKEITAANPDVVVSFGGGSTIDAAKAAEVLRSLGGDIDDYFGTGLVTKVLEESGTSLTPHVAIQAAASSGAHLTKYSNITDVSTGQKKLIVDDAIIPTNPMFDFSVTYGAPRALTTDGALDGVAHCLEVLYGAAGKPNYEKTKQIAVTGISLVVQNLPAALSDAGDTAAHDALCLATDMGAYSIMVGGTNGGHLTSFSLVDVLSHGRACAMMNPYYTVFFAPAIEDALHTVGAIYRAAGLTKADLDILHGRDLGIAVAEAMFEFARRVDFPIRLAEVPGFTDAHIERALKAAKDPQLDMKLKNMPVALSAQTIDEYMGPILEAARDGNLRGIRNA